MQYEIIPVTAFDQNCSLLWCEDSRQAAVIDPGGDLDKILLRVDALQLKLLQIWLTHAHLGHIEGLGQFGREALNSKKVKLRCSQSVKEYILKHPIWEKLFDRENLIFSEFVTNSVIPIRVPHRSKDFDTHAFLFKGKNNV